MGGVNSGIAVVQVNVLEMLRTMQRCVNNNRPWQNVLLGNVLTQLMNKTINNKIYKGIL
jgi:hypothetical protein